MAQNSITLMELKKKAKDNNLPVSGTKTELWQRLCTRYNGEDWVTEILGNRSAKIGGEHIVDKSVQEGGANDECAINQSGQIEIAEDERRNSDENERRSAVMMEIQLLEEKRRLMQMECELQRREMELSRREMQQSARGTPELNCNATVSTNLKMVAELVGDFNGTAENFEVWEKQLLLVKEAYHLTNDATKILISMKLKDKAEEWFRSKAEHISMPIDDIIIELKRMFCPNQCKV